MKCKKVEAFKIYDVVATCKSLVDGNCTLMSDCDYQEVKYSCQSCKSKIEQETAQRIFDVLNSTCPHRQNGQMAKECYYCVMELKSKYGVK